ncbi:DUF1963 domain-containing protein [Streptomyces sp. JW3]|uniref:DUF1963 domain-containing protein n=1 Tax=Streptomyces sp. JW3 TaxID=3456955 RepID=UPI003FA47621
MFENKLAAAADLFRPQAAARNLPSEDVEAFIRGVRPAIHLAEGDGPLCVGRMGGSPLLPHDAPEASLPFVFSIDCALLPAGATDLPLPADGHLLFFAWIDDGRGDGDASACYVPAGTPTTARPDAEPSSARAPYRERPLRMVGSGLSAPDSYDFAAQRWGEERDSEQQDTAHMLAETWQRATDPHHVDLHGFITLGGNPADSEVQELLEGEDGDDWECLAGWTCGDEDLGGAMESASVVWAIRRQDPAARRFDRVFGYQGQ